jgi:hypothetical protein
LHFVSRGARLIGDILKAIGVGPKLGLVMLVGGGLALTLNAIGQVNLPAVGAWAPLTAWLVLGVGALLLLIWVGEGVLSELSARGAAGALEREAEANVGALTDEERVYLNWVMRANTQRFPCDNWDNGIEGLVNKRIFYVPEHSTGGVYKVRDSVWRGRDRLIQSWSYIPHAFKPLGLMSEAERVERARV